MRLFTVGHSTATLDQLIETLRANDVQVLVDVRSKPRSRLPHFDQYPLQSAVEEAGLRYRFMGDRLGGVPRDPAVRQRWQQGRLDPVIIAHLRGSDEWADGIDELRRLITSGGGTDVCIMCSEADANECHRKAVALDVAEAVSGLEIVHLSMSKTAAGEVGVQEVLL